MWCGLLIYNLGEITAVLERICLKDHIPFMISFKWSNELFPLIKYKILNERQLAYFYFQVLLCFQFIFQEFFFLGFLNLFFPPLVFPLHLYICLITLQPPKLVIKHLAEFESCLSPPWNKFMFLFMCQISLP